MMNKKRKKNYSFSRREAVKVLKKKIIEMHLEDQTKKPKMKKIAYLLNVIALRLVVVAFKKTSKVRMK